LNRHAAAEYPIGPDPAVDAAAIVADLKSAALDCLDQVQILGAAHTAEDDFTD
jgi:hypothetical protein